MTTPPAQHAFYLTCVITLVAVPCNAIFGVVTAWLLARYDFRGKRMLDVLIDLPFAVSPVDRRPRARSSSGGATAGSPPTA